MKSKTILIADDSLVMRLKIEDELKHFENINILLAKDGEEASDLLKNNEVDGMILDLLMPNVDGYGVLKIVKQLELKLPIIVLTADIQPTTKQKCIDLGAKDVLHKPFNSDELSNAVRINFNIN